MFSEFWLEGCCAGSIEFLLPLDSTPAYFTHFAALADRLDVLAEPAVATSAASAATNASGTRTFSAFFMRLRPFLSGSVATAARPGSQVEGVQVMPAAETARSCSRPGHAGRRRHRRR